VAAEEAASLRPHQRAVTGKLAAATTTPAVTRHGGGAYGLGLVAHTFGSSEARDGDDRSPDDDSDDDYDSDEDEAEPRLEPGETAAEHAFATAHVAAGRAQ